MAININLEKEQEAIWIYKRLAPFIEEGVLEKGVKMSRNDIKILVGEFTKDERMVEYVTDCLCELVGIEK